MHQIIYDIKRDASILFNFDEGDRDRDHVFYKMKNKLGKGLISSLKHMFQMYLINYIQIKLKII